VTRARLRFEEQVAERGTGRFVNRNSTTTPTTAWWSPCALERDKLTDSVRVTPTNGKSTRTAKSAESGRRQQRLMCWSRNAGAPGHAERRLRVRPGRHQYAGQAAEGVRDNVTYTVGTVAKNDAKDYSNVNEAARASGMPG
jgi:hypothetical protein